MISCTEFIPLYSELFKFLEDIGGHEEVLRYWEYISDTYVAELLGKEVAGKGLRGCWDYWAKSLNEEACDFHMELDEQAGTFSIDMRCCPSRGMLNSLAHMEPYYDYCGHCGVLYARQLKKNGLQALRDRIENIYAAEKASDCVKCELSRRKLTVTVSRCPGVKYIRDSGNDPTKWYIECTRTVNKAIADMCGLEFFLHSYEEETGAAEYS